MRRVALILAALLAGTPGAALATCTGDLPGRVVLDVYMDATSDAVIGGIGANQCGLEVTDFCEAGRCLMFFNGLSGYVDVTALLSGTHTPPPTQFEYVVEAVHGELTFMGQSRPFEMADDRPIRIVPQADHILLSLPDPLPDNIRLTSTGSSGWEGVLPDWVGVPVPVTIYLDQVSGRQATLELFSESQMLRMDMLLRLSRVGEAAVISDRPNAAASADTSACRRANELALAAVQSGDHDGIDRYFAAVSEARIPDWDARTEAQCLDLLAALSTRGIGGDAPKAEASRPAPVVQPDTPAPHTCAALVDETRPILSGPDSAEKRAVLRAMVALGITSIDATNPKHCSEILHALGR